MCIASANTTLLAQFCYYGAVGLRVSHRNTASGTTRLASAHAENQSHPRRLPVHPPIILDTAQVRSAAAQTQQRRMTVCNYNMKQSRTSADYTA